MDMRISAGNLVDRLIDADRNGVNLQTWGLDALGNWATFIDGADDQTRAFNEANEIDVDNPHSNAPGNSISGDLDWVDPVYDAAGNMISGPKPDAETTRLHFVYDAWNRMTGAYTDDGDGVFEPGGDDAQAGSYAYDGQGRRITKTVDSVPQDFYWNEQYQNIETRKNGSSNPLDQIVYDERYVDAPIVRFHDGNTDGDYLDTEDNTDSVLFVTSDANFNVTGVINASGTVVERYTFTPYGERTIFDATWELTTGNYSWDRGHQGLACDTETGLIYNRARYLHTSLGVFIFRDRMGYVDGMNRYGYVQDSPTSRRDPWGLQATQSTTGTVVERKTLTEAELIKLYNRGNQAIAGCRVDEHIFQKFVGYCPEGSKEWRPKKDGKPSLKLTILLPDAAGYHVGWKLNPFYPRQGAPKYDKSTLVADQGWTLTISDMDKIRDHEETHYQADDYIFWRLNDEWVQRVELLRANSEEELKTKIGNLKWRVDAAWLDLIEKAADAIDQQGAVTTGNPDAKALQVTVQGERGNWKDAVSKWKNWWEE